MHNRLHTLLPAIFLSLFISRAAIARAQYYQYNGNLPFVEMMLDMMTAMGMLDKIPPQFMGNSYGGYNRLNYNRLNYNGLNYNGFNYYNNPLLRNALLNRSGWNSLGLFPSGLNSLGLNASGMNPYGMNPYGLGAYGLRPYSMSPYGQNGLSSYNTGVNSLWASPWSATPRLNSPWNNIWRDSFPQRSYPALPYYSATDGFAPRYAPLTQPPLYQYGYPYSGRRPARPVSTPLAKLYPDHQYEPDRYGPGQYDTGQYEPGRHTQPVNTSRDGEWYNRSHGSDDSPCVTEFCGLLLPSSREMTGMNPVLALDGLWETRSGEMLGIKNNRFLWSDSGSHHLSGTIRVLRGSLIAYVDSTVDGKGSRVMQYHYRIENNRLFTQDPNGRVRVFTRVPVNR